MEKLIELEIIKADLIEIDRQFQINKFKDMSSIILLKQLFVTISNLVDFELTIRFLYVDNPNISNLYSKVSRENEFIKYIRNKFVAHINKELLNTAAIWKPEIRCMFQYIHKPEIAFLYNLWILEITINTYVKPDGTHKIFNSETDLFLKKDLNRFLKFLIYAMKHSIHYLDEFGKIIGKNIQKLSFSELDLKYWEDAGKIDFKYIKKTNVKFSFRDVFLIYVYYSYF